MQDVTKSMLSFSWALSLFGLESMSTFFARGSRPASGFDAVRRSAEEQLGPGTRSAFRTGDEIQRRMVDLIFGFFDWSSFLRRGSDAMRRPGAFMPSGGAGACAGCSGRARGGPGGPPPSGWGPMPPVD